MHIICFIYKSEENSSLNQFLCATIFGLCLIYVYPEQNLMGLLQCKKE